MPFRMKSVRCASQAGFHEMVYRDWGRSDAAKTVVCVHGLTRNGRDFERLADALASDGHRVLCPDIVGRGASDRLGPGGAYEVPQYVADLTTMLAAEGLRSVDWIGTSMGGLIGMAMAAMPGGPIRRMVLNDVGPFIPKAALQRIGDYVGVEWRFDTFQKAEAHIRAAYAPFGLESDEDWRFMTEISTARDEAGCWVNAYDPRIADPFRGDQIADADLWYLWDAIRIPIFVMRGAESDLLTPEIAKEMTRRGPGAEVLEIPGCGHAPALMDSHQIGVLRDWCRSA
ncbi:MAG: alpha/beta hydrolase [Alphaproteobacteria bacterium]|nr:alpha/beta hydrolase [Alphaproteobacteria bacterium]